MCSSLVFFRLHPPFSSPFFALSPHSINPHSLPPLHFSYPPLYPILTSNSLSLIPPHSLAPFWPSPFWAFQPPTSVFQPLICNHQAPLSSLSANHSQACTRSSAQVRPHTSPFHYQFPQRLPHSSTHLAYRLPKSSFRALLLPFYFHFHQSPLKFCPALFNSAQSNAKFLWFPSSRLRVSFLLFKFHPNFEFSQIPAPLVCLIPSLLASYFAHFAYPPHCPPRTSTHIAMSCSVASRAQPKGGGSATTNALSIIIGHFHSHNTQHFALQLLQSSTLLPPSSQKPLPIP